MVKIMQIPALLLLVALVPAGARADDTVVRGFVDIATGTPASNGNARPARCLYQLDPSLNGHVGFVIERVIPASEFTLKRVTGTAADFDIDFFQYLTGCDEDPVKTEVDYDNRSGNEHGFIPDDADLAIVTMRSGQPQSTFVFTEIAE